MAAVASVWAETSIRWIRKNAPLFTSREHSLSFSLQLYDSLVQMEFRKGEMVTRAKFADAAWRAYLEKATDEWSRSDHERMKVHISNLAALAGKHADAILLDEIENDGIELEMDENYLEMDEVEAMLTPKSQLSPEHELEEIVASITIKDDPRYGVW